VEHGRSAGAGTTAVPEARLFCVPLRIGGGLDSLGALGVASAGNADQRRFLEAMARHLALAVTRARLAEQAAAAQLSAKTESMRSALLSTVSHDLRTPLAVIKGAASTLRDSGAALGREETAGLLASIVEESDRLERLVANLLEMTQLESKSLVPKREWVPVDELVSSALSRLEEMLASRVVSVASDSDLPLLHVDPVLLEQVLINLVENAAKYSPADAPIELSARASSGTLVLEVRDRGPGIPKDAQEKVFEKFFRVPTPGAARGAGLGLAICKGIVEAHGGTIRAGDRPGGGSVFTVTLPLPAEQPS
jgi:two-component system sensor histidine kinase KdpD